MKRNQQKDEFEKLIEMYRRSLNDNLPLTKAQIAQMEKEMERLPSVPDEISDPDALLARGYVAYSKLIENQVEMVNDSLGMAMAARNGETLSEESMQKIIRLMDEDDEEKSEKDSN